VPHAWDAIIQMTNGRSGTAISADDARRWRALASAQCRLARIAAAHGVTSPWELPTTTAALTDCWRNWSEGNAAGATYTMRVTARTWNADHAAHRLLPMWAAHQQTAERRPRLLAKLPLFMQDLDDWRELAGEKAGDRTNADRHRTRHNALRPATEARYESSAMQVAELVIALHAKTKLPEVASLDAFTFESLWTPVVRSVSVASRPSSSAAVQARRERLGIVSPVRRERNATEPLIVAVIHRALDAGLFPKASRRPDGGLPSAPIQLMFALFSMTERLAIATHGDDSDAVQSLRDIWTPHQPHLAQALDHAALAVKPIDRFLRVVTLPQLIVGVLPWWTLVELPRLARLATEADAETGYDDASHAARRDAVRTRRTYCAALEHWAAVATFTAEPMRHENVQRARVGQEIHISATYDRDGTLLTVRSVSSAFPARGHGDRPEHETKSGEARDEWRWSPSIIDYTWAAHYLRDVWFPALLQTGLVSAGTSIRAAIEAAQFAWFVNPTPKSARDNPGGEFLAPESLTDRFCNGLLSGLHATGRVGLPINYRDTLRQEWPFVFGPHIVRTLWVTYWYGLRADDGAKQRIGDSVTHHSGRYIACTATLDTEPTLKKHYAKASPAMKALQRDSRQDSFEHPRAFDTQMDATWWNGRVVDWDRLWSDASFPIPESLRAARRRERVAAENATRRKRRRRRSLGAIAAPGTAVVPRDEPART